MIKSKVSLVAVALLFVLLLTAVVVVAAPEGPQQGVVAKLPPVAIGAHRLAGEHLVPPSREALAGFLEQQGVPLDATPEQRKAVEDAWMLRFHKRSDTWVSPSFQEWVDDREAELADSSRASRAIQPVTATVFYLAVDFGATETFTIPMNHGYDSQTGEPICVTETHTITGPLHGLVEHPPATDNFTLWYSPTQVEDPGFYEDLLFGYAGAGRVRMDMVDPYDHLPGIDLAGYTMQDYYDRVAGVGNVHITGTVDGWVTVDHTEGYYGANNCATDSSYSAIVPVATLVIDALDKFKADHPTYWTDPNFWPKYDGNKDGVVDSFGVIHAGADESSGGGAEGPWAIWAHSSDLRNYSAWPSGYKVYEGDAGTTADDIIVAPYTMQPEMLDVGVLCEEFGHNFFGLPDLYVSDASNSIGDWAIMSGGAWMGWLGGTTPASMPLWFKMVAAFDTGGTITPVNWQEPMLTRQYNDPAQALTIYNLENTPAGKDKGVRVNLPGYTEQVPNNAGTGKAPYSGTGRNDLNITLTRQIPIPAGAAGILTVDAYWDIEEDWDYGYLMVNGATTPDMDGVTTNTDPNGNNLGNGITGFGQGTLRFDLSAKAGTTVDVAFRYRTDSAVTQPGWWIDNVKLDGVAIDDFEGATAPGTFPGWTNSAPGWYVAPTTSAYNRYYLVEWRTKTKYDGKIAETAYIHNKSDEVNGDVVSRIPYNMPAAVVYFRDTKYSNTYAQRPNYADPPSYGSKYQLLVVDQNWEPVRAISGTTFLGYWTGRVSAYDAGLTLQDALPWTIPSYFARPTWPVQNYPAQPKITHFNDALGYYAGYYFGSPCPAGFVCYAERDGSVVIPARDLYSTRITTFNFAPFYGLYGVPWAPSWLGSGNPGDDNAQFGVNMVLQAMDHANPENSWATLNFYNYSVDFLTGVDYWFETDGLYVQYTTEIKNVGTETATDVVYELYHDPDLTILSIEAPASAQRLAEPRAARDLREGASPDDSLVLNLPIIRAGESFTVTVLATFPLPETPGDVYIGAEVWGDDGQIVRGPWWPDVYIAFYRNYLPIIGK